MVRPTAGHMDIKHFQRLVFRDEPMRCAGREPQKIAGLQALFLAVEHGGPVAAQDEVEFLRYTMITDSGSLIGTDGNAVDGRPTFLGPG